MENSDRAEKIIEELEQERGKRSVWESHWQEIAERILPAYSGVFTNRGIHTPGEKRTEEVIDSTASIALTRFAAAMEHMLTPRSSIWHNLRPSDDYLLKDRETKMWFEEANKLMFKFRYSPKANYASQQHEIYMSLGAFGTGALFIDELYGMQGIRYRATNLSEIFFMENHQGMIDKVFRVFKMTARQMMQRWGSRVPKEIQDKALKQPNCEYEIIHCVKPNDEYEGGRKDYKGMPFGSEYVSITGKTILQTGGYNSFPYAISRYVTAPGEIYGRSPAMQVLPAIKTLNEQKKSVLKQGHRAIDPVLLAYDDGIIDDFSMKPGALNFGGVSAEGRPLVHTLPVGQLTLAKEMMDEERAIINDAFLVTLFQILVETPQMTATEVMERTREKGALLAPTMGRQQSEALGPQIDRELDILAKQRLLPPMPRALIEAQGEYRIEYDSPLSRAQRAEEGAGALRTVQWAADIAANTQDPSTLDHFNFDAMIPELADINAMPTRWINDPKTVDAKRKGRQQSQATQQMIDAGPTIAAMTKQGQVNQL